MRTENTTMTTDHHDSDGEQVDWQMLRAWRAGDDVAGEALIGRHVASLIRFFRRTIKDPSVVTDLIVETLGACARAEEPSACAGRFRSLLYWSAVRTLRRYFDQKAVRSGRRGSRAQVNRLRWLSHAVRQLPLDQRAVLELSYLEGLSGPQIAELLGTSTATVYQHLRCGTLSLRATTAKFPGVPKPVVKRPQVCPDHAVEAQPLAA